ncbi:sen1 [Symbiodinium microadriaticum]|nr:sen1 [Symbiodinium microadriaticum]
MWTACVLAPKPPFLHQIVGARGATHQIFTDSDAESEMEQAEAGMQAQPEGKVPISDSEESSQPSQRLCVEGLNVLQKEAISKILSSDGLHRRCHLLQGPPGTGKTRAVVALLQQLAQRHKLGKEGRILVSAPSNGAVQVALESFSKTEEGRRCPLCLVGVEDRVPPDGPLRAAFIHTRVQHALALVKQSFEDPQALQEAAEALRTLERSVPAAYLRLKLPRNLSAKHLQKCLESWEEESPISNELPPLSAEGEETSASESEREAHSSRRPVRGSLVERLTELARRERFGEAPEFETEQLKAAAAVFCTLSCAGRPGLQMTLRDGIETVLVDEAAQAIEAETLVPLCLQPKQLVLVGDPMQLSATVCHSDMAKSAHFCRSMMERLMGLGQEHIMLQEQYRMHPEISRFPSARFYGGRLVDVLAGGSQDSKHQALPPYAVVDVAGTEEVYHQESRIINRREAESLACFAKHLASVACMGKNGLVTRRCPPLVVITFYNGQATLIRKLLVETGIEVHTVDSFQGSEAEVVLLSFVRANAQRRLGFLSEFRRLNVALTRAKHSLILFANAALLKGSFSDDVTALFEDASRRKLIWKEEQLSQLLSSTSGGRQAAPLVNEQLGQRSPAKRAFSSPEFTKGKNLCGRKRQRQPESKAFTDAPLKEPLQPRRPGGGEFKISDAKTCLNIGQRLAAPDESRERDARANEEKNRMNSVLRHR